MKNELVISVLSKNRPNGTTFNFLKDVWRRVYVFVDAQEEETYKKALPDNYIIVTHHEKTIGAIRNYVHFYHKKRDHASIILDDDITAIYKAEGSDSAYKKPASINDFVQSVLSVASADLIITTYMGFNSKDTDETIKNLKYRRSMSGCYVVYPHVFGVWMNTGEWANEDFDGYLQYRLANKNIIGLPYAFYHECGTEGTHFNNDWRVISKVTLYERYGDLCVLKFFPDIPIIDKIPYTVAGIQLNEYYDFVNKYGIKYCREGNNNLQSLIKYFSANSIVREQLEIIWKNIKDKPLRPENEQPESGYNVIGL